MDSPSPDIVFAYEGSPYSDEVCAEFREAVAAEGLDLAFQRLPSTRVWAGLDWLLPTAFMVWVAKPYFDGFLEEAGRDHYVALKKGIKLVAERLSRVTVTKIGTPGKVAPIQPYSLVFSVWFKRDEESQFKFLIPNSLSPEETETALESFFAFLDGWHAGTLAQAERAAFETARGMGRVVLLAYSAETKQIEVVDPMAAHSDQPI
ncbi:hypothetical protein [Brevundimonas sp. UBA2416]|uniref:hypothetical protein n=1 Tax=Brevundimonas sp. UBA2416 TaxID=1946124 RepID=UPI0025C5A237|nr:hypothetical protein [Brevundimonas sp. UBA2416]